jgi:hypothetical protein
VDAGGMRRRDFIGLIGGAAVTWAPAARAERIARVGYLGLTSATSVQAIRIDAFRVASTTRDAWIFGVSIAWCVLVASLMVLIIFSH